jgi:hypothetical protein
MGDDNKVVDMYSGLDVTPGQPNQKCVDTLKEALEQAESGEISGVVIVKRVTASGEGVYDIGGVVGGYSMLGAIQCVGTGLERIAMGEDEGD